MKSSPIYCALRKFSAIKYPTYKLPNPPMSLSCGNIDIDSIGGARIINLNRPQALNALNKSMICSISNALSAWEKSPECRMIIIRSSEGSKAFCAGGDILHIANSRGNIKEQMDFFAHEYSLNHQIATYSKPIISILDGFTMGGGAGISIHGTFRIATEKTKFAMPEIKIGFIPDVGSSFFLPKLDFDMGKYLSTTGAQINGWDAYMCGLATHYIPSHRLGDMVRQLYDAENEDHINILLNLYCEVGQGSIEINKSSRKNEADSPISIELSKKLLEFGKNHSLVSCLSKELDVVNGILELYDDFYFAVKRKLVEKESFKEWQTDLSIVEKIFNYHAKVKIVFKNNSDLDKPKFLKYSLPPSDTIKLGMEQLPCWYKKKPGLDQKLGLIQN